MKRLILLCTLVLGGFVQLAWGQEALWSRSEIISPQVGEDGRVTFRYMAPEAHSVAVAGDFTTKKIALERQDSGLWEFTTEPLQSELYTYYFEVDGLRQHDPNNVYLQRDIAQLTNIFLVGGGCGDLYSVQEVPHGSITRAWYPSPTLQTERRISIYTPAGYDSGKSRYPVLYLLHGMGGDEEAWLTLGRAAQILDNLIAAGQAEPMIVVMTNGNADLEGAPGETAQGLYKPTTRLKRTMEGSFESSFMDVVEYVEKHYRTYKKPEQRAIAGLSMGGFHALHISRYYAPMFGYVGLFSAAIRPERAVNSPIYAEFEQGLKRQKELGFSLYWIACGEEDFLWERNTAYRTLLDQMEFPYTFRVSDGGHTWRNWRIYLSEFLPQLFKK